MTRVIIGAADQSVAADLRNRLSEVEDVDVVYYAETTAELSAAIARDKPDVVFIHDLLGPELPANAIRDVVFRSPATAPLLISSVDDPESAMAAFEAGAKGVLRYPFALEEVLAKLSTAREWSQRMGGLLSGATQDSNHELGRRGRVTVFAGAKGGVGTTTIATHMALDLNRKMPGTRVCLVDLDLQSGDISGILEARQRVSIADVARVSEDLSSRTVTDALVMHDSGVALLLTPIEIHETEFVTASAIRAILALLRQEFDVILVDGGAHATPAQAAAVEVADEVVAIVTPDVLAMRSWRRTVTAWEGLGVRTEDEVHLLINRVSREDVLTPEALARLTAARIVSTRLPAMFRRLERAVNSRNPSEVRESVWWSALEKIGAEVGVTGPVRPAETRAVETPGADTSAATRAARRPRSRRERRAASESGQIAMETVALVPVVITLCLLVWQVGLTGLAFVWNGHAANEAARALSIGEDPGNAARSSMPSSMRSSIRVNVQPDGASVRVASDIPVLCPGCGKLPKQIVQTARAVNER